MALFFSRILGRCHPASTAFVASLFLSLVAVQGRLVNRDGIYFLDTARAIMEQGIGAKVGEWTFYPLVIAAFGATTPLSLEHTAFLINALLMAGTCSLMVHWVIQRSPEAAWAAVLVVLALPAFNLYRSDILREYGFWFFSLTGLWLAMRWHDTGRWRDALGCQAALVVAVLFRLEAVVFFFALALWQVFSSPRGHRLRGVILLNLVPIIGLCLAGLMFATGAIGTAEHLGSRVARYSEAINLVVKLQQFSELAQRFSEHVLQARTKYSSEEAGTILFFGLLALIPVKFVSSAGVLVLPLAYLGMREHWREVLVRWQPLPWAFLMYSVALAAFVTQELFLSARYVSFLHWLAVPLFACGLQLFWTRFPRGKPWFIVILLIVAIANVVSTSQKKTYIVDAGRWLAEHGETGVMTCVNNMQIAYYAGWRTHQVPAIENLDLMSANKLCHTVAIKIAAKELTSLRQRLQALGYAELAYFGRHGEDAVIVARRLP